MNLRKGFSKADIPSFLPKSQQETLVKKIEKRDGALKKAADTKRIKEFEEIAKKTEATGKNATNVKIMKSGEKFIEDTKGLIKAFVTDEADYLPIDVLIQYKKAGITNAGIAELVGVSIKTVENKLSPYMEEIKTLEIFKKSKIDMLNIVQRRLLQTFTQENIDNMSAKERATTFGIMFDKTRVEEGKPTNTVLTHFNFIQQFTSPTQDFDKETDVVDVEFTKD